MSGRKKCLPPEAGIHSCEVRFPLPPPWSFPEAIPRTVSVPWGRSHSAENAAGLTLQKTQRKDWRFQTPPFQESLTVRGMASGRTMAAARKTTRRE